MCTDSSFLLYQLWDQIDGVASLVGLTEFAYVALLAWLAIAGGGPLSLDALIRRGARPERSAVALAER